MRFGAIEFRVLLVSPLAPVFDCLGKGNVGDPAQVGDLAQRGPTLAILQATLNAMFAS